MLRAEHALEHRQERLLPADAPITAVRDCLGHANIAVMSMYLMNEALSKPFDTAAER